MRFALLPLLAYSATAFAVQPGYYRQPAIHGDTVVFAAEGDLWRVGVSGGPAVRLTTHPGEEGLPAISPDGKTLAFSAQYDGVTDVYTMPIDGGIPVRRTWGAGRIPFIGWTADGRLLHATDADSTLPAVQLAVIDIAKRTREIIPLAQAADGTVSADGTVYFTRLPFQGSYCKRYRGGTVQHIWRFRKTDAEATLLTGDYAGTSKSPMLLGNRIAFLSDRSGTMNIWSMNTDGKDLKQHTQFKDFDIISAAVHGDRVVFHRKTDLGVLEPATGRVRELAVTLQSDFDHTREKLYDRPMNYLSHAQLSPNGDRLVLVARGRTTVVPTAKNGRVVTIDRGPITRCRDAHFMPDGRHLLLMSDESGEVEFWKVPVTGGKGEQLTKDGEVLRWEGVPSPDGRYIAHHDKNQVLRIVDLEKQTNKKIDDNIYGDFGGLRWSPDGKWLAYAVDGENQFRRIKIYRVADGISTYVTTDRYDSFNPAWDPNGKYLYFLSERTLNSTTSGPWGNYQPEPHFDRRAKIYFVTIANGLRSPFLPKEDFTDPESVKKEIEIGSIEKRLHEVPLPAGNYSDLFVNDKGLFWRSSVTGGPTVLLSAAIGDKTEIKQMADGVSYLTSSKDGQKLLVRKGDALFVVDANVGAPLGSPVDLSGWTIAVRPRDEWRQMFADAWRMERDYFYDRGMHGTDWSGVRKKYEPFVDRVASRGDLNDLLAQMVSELSALHMSVRGGDIRKGPDDVAIGYLGGRFERNEKLGGFRIAHLYESDPDEPSRSGPLTRPEIAAKVDDVIEMIDGIRTLDVDDLGELLRRKVGRPVQIRLKSGDKSREVVVRPIAADRAADLRYHEWEYQRRVRVDRDSRKTIGYVHMRAMGSGNYTEFAKDFYPAYTRQGMIIDVRNNRGGNIDSWILSRLSRKAWFYWSQRVGRANSWNMQQTFRGHVVVLCNEFTMSDGEAFCEGIKRLKIGSVIGTRTWGGEIWLRANNFLVDGGIATAAEFGVFGPEGTWLIEGHGVDPDIVVDNAPHSAFKGEDAQLERAIQYLRQKIQDDPREVPAVPKFPTPAKEKEKEKEKEAPRRK